MSQTSLNDRQRAFLMISLLLDPLETADLLPFLNPAEESPLRKVFERLAKQSKETKKQIIIDELKRLYSTPQQLTLGDLHSDWVVDALKKESPRTIGTILRHLPGEYIKEILEKLPQEILSDLPPMSETFSLDPELVQIIRRRFENNFFSFLPKIPLSHLNSFESIPYFPKQKLSFLFRKLGFVEVAMAFATLHQDAIKHILNRLPTEDSDLLGKHIEQRENVSQVRLSKAQSHILSLDLQKGASENLVLEAGFFLYSKALLPIHLDGALMIQQKFPINLGRLLKKYIEKNLPLNSEKTVGEYQKEILRTLEWINKK